MIPPSEVELDDVTRLRWAVTKAAWAAVRAGVPADLVMVDAREGVERGIRVVR